MNQSSRQLVEQNIVAFPVRETFLLVGETVDNPTNQQPTIEPTQPNDQLTDTQTTQQTFVQSNIFVDQSSSSAKLNKRVINFKPLCSLCCREQRTFNEIIILLMLLSISSRQNPQNEAKHTKLPPEPAFYLSVGSSVQPSIQSSIFIPSQPITPEQFSFFFLSGSKGTHGWTDGQIFHSFVGLVGSLGCCC